MNHALALIPARLGSTRLPGKMLADVAGLPLFVRTYQAVQRAACFERVVVVTDSEHIMEVAERHGAEAMLSLKEHASGTDRIAEALEILLGRMKGKAHNRLGKETLEHIPQVVVNVQGDEPLVPAVVLQALVGAFDRPEREVVTAACPMPLGVDPAHPDRVKVVLDASGKALYFSRLPVPGRRDTVAEPPNYLMHLGLYAFRPSRLLEFPGLSPAPSEKAEMLEQLRLLHHGIPVHVLIVDAPEHGVDNADDLERVRRYYLNPSS